MYFLKSDTSDNLFQFIAQRHIIAILLARGIPPFVNFRFLTHNSIIVVRLIGGISQQTGVLVVLVPSLSIAGIGVIFIGASFGLPLSLYRSWITELAPERFVDEWSTSANHSANSSRQ